MSGYPGYGRKSYREQYADAVKGNGLNKTPTAELRRLESLARPVTSTDKVVAKNARILTRNEFMTHYNYHPATEFAKKEYKKYTTNPTLIEPPHPDAVATLTEQWKDDAKKDKNIKAYIKNWNSQSAVTKRRATQLANLTERLSIAHKEYDTGREIGRTTSANKIFKSSRLSAKIRAPTGRSSARRGNSSRARARTRARRSR